MVFAEFSLGSLPPAPFSLHNFSENLCFWISISFLLRRLQPSGEAAEASGSRAKGPSVFDQPRQKGGAGVVEAESIPE